MPIDKPAQGGSKKDKEMVSKSSLSRANGIIAKLEERGKRAKLRLKKSEAQVIQTAHHGGQHALSISTAASLSYAHGRYGDEYMKPGGFNVRRWGGGALLVGGLVAEGMGHDVAGGYVQAVGAGAVMSDVCSSAYDAGVRAKYKSQANQPAATTQADPAANVQVTPADKTAGDRRGPPRPRVQPRNGGKHRLDPDRRQATVPPHLRHLFNESRAA